MLGTLSKRILVIAAFSTLVGCSARMPPATAPGAEDKPLRIIATTSAMPLVMEAAAAYDDLSLTLDIRTGNYRQAIAALRRGEADFVVTTHLDSSDAADLWAAPVAQDAIVFVVNLANPVDELRLVQVRQTYQGRISSWSAFGPYDEPLTVVSREAGAGIRAEFEQLVMGARPTTGAAMTAASTEGVLRTVASIPGALGYVSMAALDGTVRPLAIDGVLPSRATLNDNTYPLRSTVFVVASTEPQGAPRGFVGWMQSPDGQAAFSRLYPPVLVTPPAN